MHTAALLMGVLEIPGSPFPFGESGWDGGHSTLIAVAAVVAGVLWWGWRAIREGRDAMPIAPRRRR